MFVPMVFPVLHSQQLSESLFALQEVFHDCVRSVCQLCVTACGQCPQLLLELCAPVGV